MNVKENQGPIRHEAWGEQVTGNNQLNIFTYYADDEMQGFLLWLKNYIFTARCEDTIFIFHVWGYWCHHGYQQNYQITIELLAQARGRLIWN